MTTDRRNVMDVIADLPRRHHPSSQSVAQAAALLSQLNDVMARHRDRPARPVPAHNAPRSSTARAMPNTANAGMPPSETTYTPEPETAENKRPSQPDQESPNPADPEPRTPPPVNAHAEAREAATAAGRAFPTPAGLSYRAPTAPCD